MRRRTQLEDEEAALSGFVEGLAPFVKPCALIGGALILASLLGPQERHEETLSMFEGGVGTQRGLHLAHFHAAALENPRRLARPWVKLMRRAEWRPPPV